ncbi:GL11763 [Drosophila persimilis]|uniref:GL11763 n=1 Tax=Drosophila persimilis TaxID=7234 RepID=B4H717_DROPE|nr:GL11763 [Drosophila persimilis]
MSTTTPCISPSYDRLPDCAAAGVQQEYPCPAPWANSQKPRNIALHAMKARRLLISTDVGSHQAIIRVRVDGNERMEL